ncbi:MAG: SulP family inorganic anion transporter [Candidatus Binatia bacterium]
MTENTVSVTDEKPQNGFAGFKYWRFDLMAGLQVALVSLPLSLGIAIASGAPPVTGLISAIIAGFVYPILGGSYVTIAGPAAGLAPALLSGMLTLGNGDLAAGYPLLLVAICLTGLVQILLTVFKVGEFARIIPIPVMEGMLAAIGLIIIVKQIPLLLGDLTPPGKSIPLAILSLPASLWSANFEVCIIGVISVVLMFWLSRARIRWLKILPPPLFIVCIGIVYSYLMEIDATYLINLPDNVFKDGFTLPDFVAVWRDPSLWPRILVVVITLTLIDGIESLATVAAVDKIDPFQRRSDPNKTLRAMAVSNVVSSIAGGLTIIPGGIKSRANVDAGGRTLWSNAYNSIFLIIFVLLGKDLINRIPLATLAAVLIYVGWRLCEPTVWTKVVIVGKDQLLLFVFTIAAVLAVDLLFGIIAGIVAKAVLLLYLQIPPVREILTSQIGLGQFAGILAAHFKGLFATPVRRKRVHGLGGRETYSVYLSSTTSFNLLKLEKHLESIPSAADITLVFTPTAHIVDHTALEHLHYFQEQCLREGRRCEIRGLEIFRRFSKHPLSGGLHDAKLHKEKEQLTVRQQALSDFARSHRWEFAPTIVSALNEHNFLYLARGSAKEESNIIAGSHKGLEIKIFDYSYTDMLQFFAETRHTMILMKVENGALRIPDCVLEPDGFVGSHLIHDRDIHLTEGLHFPQRYHLHGQEEQAVRGFFSADLIRFFDTHPDVYLETRGNWLLAFRVYAELEEPGSLGVLLSLADAIAHACIERTDLSA